MTAATPGRELVALADYLQGLILLAEDNRYSSEAVGISIRNGLPTYRKMLAALRLAAKPADVDGKWFGEFIPQSDVTPKRVYWWRSKFRSMGEPKR